MQCDCTHSGSAIVLSNSWKLAYLFWRTNWRQEIDHLLVFSDILSCLGFLLLWGDTQEGNFYKGKHLFEALLHVQKYNQLSSMWETWQCLGKHGTGERAERSLFCSKENQKTVSPRQLGKGSQSPLPQSHTSSKKGRIYSNKGIPPNTATPWVNNIQTTVYTNTSTSSSELENVSKNHRF